MAKSPPRYHTSTVFGVFDRHKWEYSPTKWSQFSRAASHMFKSLSSGMCMGFTAPLSVPSSPSSVPVSGLTRLGISPTQQLVYDTWLKLGKPSRDSWDALLRLSTGSTDDVRVSLRRCAPSPPGVPFLGKVTLQAVLHMNRRLTSRGTISRRPKHSLKAAVEIPFAKLVPGSAGGVAALVSHRGLELGGELLVPLGSGTSWTTGVSAGYSVAKRKIKWAEAKLEYTDHDSTITLYTSRKTTGATLVQWISPNVVSAIDICTSPSGALLSKYVLALRTSQNTALRIKGESSATSVLSFTHASGSFYSSYLLLYSARTGKLSAGIDIRLNL